MSVRLGVSSPIPG